MSDQLAPPNLAIENNDAVENNPIRTRGAMAMYGLLVFVQQAGKLKESVAEKGAEISQRQEKIKLIHDILQTINKLSDEMGLDITNHPDIQEKLKVAKELGVDFDDTQLKFTTQDRDFLKESLQLTEKDFIDENKVQTQKMQMLIQETDRWLTLANTILKNTERTNKSYIDKIR